MRIASLDYGLNFGLAIACIFLRPKNIVLEQYSLETVYNSVPHIMYLIKIARCTSVILEQCPSQAANMGSKIFEQTCKELLQLGFLRGNEIKEIGRFVTVSPGIWKPFMQSQHIDFSNWNPKTQHERDAMSMLWYMVKTTWPKSEVLYV